MDEFVSSFTNKIDAKGRVSVPASFRAVLAKEQSDEIFCHPALDSAALDAGGPRLVKHIRGLLEDLAPYSDEKDQLATALFGESEYLKIDSDGRIVLPQRLRDVAGFKGQVTFVGLGDKFQMWEPEQFEEARNAARSKVRDLRKLLGKGRSAE
ncbi:MAG: division/cell wall cluster transcriptional repressor MraZ [Rhizobiales bacterium]|nr:division/cell wall cluster transcriptional repressor MraZ [Hyphomicrobiales bacterium]